MTRNEALKDRITDTADEPKDQAQYQPTKRGPEHERLEVFLGRWKTEGQAYEGPFGPAARITAVETYEWLPGRQFLVHRLEGRLGDNDMACIEVTGYEASSGSYSVRSFYNDGTHLFWQARESGGTWTFTGDGKSEGKSLKMRCTTVFNAGDTITGRFEYSRDGSSWHPFWETTLTRA
jgi:hypothetical protein